MRRSTRVTTQAACGKNLAPFGEGLVGAQEQGQVGVVAPGDDLEEEVSIAAVG